MIKVIALGRLTRDPEIRYSQGANATAIANYSLAVDRKFKKDGEPDADFFNCTSFGKGAEFTEKYLKKGTKILITGRLQNDTYTNKDGQKVTVTKIMVEEQEFAESKNTNSNTTNNVPAPQSNPNVDGFVNIPSGNEDELPFA